jgi:hypothetical protein
VERTRTNECKSERERERKRVLKCGDWNVKGGGRVDQLRERERERELNLVTYGGTSGKSRKSGDSCGVQTGVGGRAGLECVFR